MKKYTGIANISQNIQAPADCAQYAKIPETPRIPAHHDFSGACVHWGDVWYKTFDGQVFGYGGEGPFTLFTTQAKG